MAEGKETFGGTKIYHIKTDIFNGPFDVLLELIEKRKLFINDIALAQVTDDFIEYIRDQGGFPMQEGAHFILVASTLILIKSRSLLPTMDLTEEEEKSIEDLEKRLEIYKEVREEALRLKEIWGTQKLFFGHGEESTQEISFVPDEAITKDALYLTAHEIIDRTPKEEVMTKVKVEEVVKLETVIDSLIKRVNREMKTSFKNFSGIRETETGLNKEKRYKVIVSFIAVLELVKQGLLTAHQDEDNNDIYIENSEVGIPHYI
ncbi:MAG: segregation and condensation protein A [Candidatus Paceibacterota bacterium]